MRNRLFLLALLAALILIQAVLRSAAMSTPFHGGSTLGGYTFWELRGVLPLGVFAAGSLLFLSAAAAQCTQAILQLVQKNRSGLIHKLGSIASAGLWCGAPCLAACYNALPYIFPWLNDYDPQVRLTAQHMEWVLHGSLIALILCRVLTLSKPGVAACITLSLSLLCLLACGQMWFGIPFILLPIGLMGAGGAAMILGRGRRWAAIPLLTAVIMNAVLFGLNVVIEHPLQTVTYPETPFWATYTCTLLLLAPALFLKVTSLLRLH